MHIVPEGNVRPTVQHALQIREREDLTGEQDLQTEAIQALPEDLQVHLFHTGPEDLIPIMDRHIHQTVHREDPVEASVRRRRNADAIY